MNGSIKHKTLVPSASGRNLREQEAKPGYGEGKCASTAQRSGSRMSMTQRPQSPRSRNQCRQKGVTIVELMVAILIGLLAMYAVYRVYEGTERTKRTVASIGEAQSSGLYSAFLLEYHIQNGGASLMLHRAGGNEGNATLIDCPAGAVVLNPTPDVGDTTATALSTKPLPVVITQSQIGTRNSPGTANTDFDDVYVYAGNAAHHMILIPVNGGFAQRPFGFRSGSVLLDVAHQCAPYIVSQDLLDANNPPGVAIGGSIVGASGPPPDGATLLDLGHLSRTRFHVDEDYTLQMEEWTLNEAGQWLHRRTEPVATGVMLFKAEYGINPTPSVGVGVSQWVRPENNWDVETLRNLAASNISQLEQIQAIRFSLIVRGDEPEKAETFDQPTSFNVFNDCPVNTTSAPGACPAPVLQKTYPARSGPNETTYRYRMYEKVVPLRNSLWNQTTP